MKKMAYVVIVAVLCTPIFSSAQSSTPRSDDIQVELAKENKFVVKVLNVFNNSGNKISGIREVVSFSNEKKIFVFKTAKGKTRRISDAEIQKFRPGIGFR